MLSQFAVLELSASSISLNGSSLLAGASSTAAEGHSAKDREPDC